MYLEMERNPLQQHREDQALNQSMLDFVNDFPEQAAKLLQLAYEEIQVDEKIKLLEAQKAQKRRKTISAVKALRQLEGFNTPGFTDDDSLPRNKQAIIRDLMSPPEKSITKRRKRSQRTR